MKKSLSILLFALFPVALLEAPARAPYTLMLRVICLPARPPALIVADEQHLFEKHGVRVEAEVAPNSEALRSGLTAGKYDMAHAAIDNAVALAEQAHADIVVVIGGEGSTNELIAQPEFDSIGSLKGHTLIVDAPTTAYAIQLKAILQRNGLHEGTDYQLKAIGGTPARLAAMRDHKEYGASILGPPTSLLAKHEGFISLGSTQKWLGPYQGIGGFTSRAWANAHRNELQGYIAAFVEAQRWLVNPTNKPQVVALLRREYKLSDELAVEAYNTWIVGPGGLQTDARIDTTGLKNVLTLRQDVEHTWTTGIPSVDRFYDSSFYEAVISAQQSH